MLGLVGLPILSSAVSVVHGELLAQVFGAGIERYEVEETARIYYIRVEDG